MEVTEKQTQRTFAQLTELQKRVEADFFGKERVVRLVIASLVSGGHILLEDLPGTGKTLLAKTIAKNIGADFSRIQFTPDLLPSDIIGISLYDQLNKKFTFRKGPIFSNIVLADEINRASAKTQSALLEAMEEKQVTIDGETHRLEEPFFVIATDNPIEHTGTFNLPEAQLDRFLVKTRIGKIDETSAMKILNGEQLKEHAEKNERFNSKQISQIRKDIDNVFVSEMILDYILKIITAISLNSSVEFSPSIRGALAIKKISQVFAVFHERDFVIPDDIQEVIEPCLNHRILLTPDAKFAGKTSSEIIDDALKEVETPK